MITTLFGSVPPDAPTPPSPDAEPGAPKTSSLLDRLKAGIQKTRAGFLEKLEDAVSGRKEIDADVLEELEYALITADIGTPTTNEILERIRAYRRSVFLPQYSTEADTALKQEATDRSGRG